MINFYKYQGAGNDFILIDNRNFDFQGDKVSFVQKWCDRRFGIGSDGLIFLEESRISDFKMDFYNPDGSQSFCGNGSRCAVAFARFVGIDKAQLSFEAIDGLHTAEWVGGDVKVGMHQVDGIKGYGQDEFINTGSPHYISYQSEDNEKDVLEFGRKIRYSEEFKPAGTNVNLITVLGEDHIAIRTYERGVEDETLACGTGATACGLSFAARSSFNQGVIKVDAQGGALKIHFTKTEKPGYFEEIWLEGPAKFVFKGELEDVD